MSKPFYDEKYFKFISDIQDATREMIKTIIVETFIEIDLPFKNSTERSKKMWWINQMLQELLQLFR